MNQPIKPASTSSLAERSQGANTVIAPGSFVPSDEAGQKSSGLSGKVIALLVAAFIAVLVLGLLFTARSVNFQFVPANASFKLDGLLQFELGGTYLVFPGTYRLNASAAGYEPLQQDLSIAGERNQFIEIEMVELPGRINLGSTPQGATVTIDGEDTPTYETVKMNCVMMETQ